MRLQIEKEPEGEAKQDAEAFLASGLAVLQDAEVEAIIARRAQRWGWDAAEVSFRVAVMVQARQSDKRVGFATGDLALHDTGSREGLVTLGLHSFHRAMRQGPAQDRADTTSDKKQAVAQKLLTLKQKEQEANDLDLD